MALKSFVLAGSLALSPQAGDAMAESLSIEDLRSENGLPALAGYGFRGDQALEQSVGVRKLGDPTLVAASDRWHIGSCSKAMTATLVAVLVEEGYLAWESTLADLFPEIERMSAGYRDVTMAELLAHWSGLGAMHEFAGGDLWRLLWDESLDPVDGRKRVARAMLSTAPAVSPRSFSYSNANYVVAAAAIERLTGRSWESLIQERLFDPLEMKSCGFGAAGDASSPHPDQPWGHAAADVGPLSPVPPGFGADNPPTMAPAGGIHCSMADWARFLRIHLQGFRGDATPILRPGTFRVLHTPFAGGEYTPGGWIRVDRPWAGGAALTHAGSNTLNFARTWLAPGLDAAVLSVSNAAGSKAEDATDEVVARLLRGLGADLP